MRSRLVVRKSLGLLLIFVLLLSLSGCGVTKSAHYQDYVKSILTANYLGVFGEEIHHFQGIGHMPLQPQREGLQALQEDEAADR